MTNKPEGPKSGKDKLGVKSDTYTQVPDDDKIKGGVDTGRNIVSGIGGRKKTYDPTDTAGCCDK